MEDTSIPVIGIMAALRDLAGALPVVASYPDCTVFSGTVCGASYTVVVDREDRTIDVVVKGLDRSIPPWIVVHGVSNVVACAMRG